MSKHYDVIIVGAGMVGATLAAALGGQQTLKIALIEPFAHKPILSTDHADLRVSAISQASENLLKNLNIWPHFNSKRLSTFTDMKVWETESSTIHFDSADIGEPHLGCRHHSEARWWRHVRGRARVVRALFLWLRRA